MDFLDSKAFCKNSRHMKGEAMMKKRHLEILGYHVVQVSEASLGEVECGVLYVYLNDIGIKSEIFSIQ